MWHMRPLCCYFNELTWMELIPTVTNVLAELSDYQGSAVLMNLCAQLMCQLPSLGPKQIRQQRMAYTIAAQAGLEVTL